MCSSSNRSDYDHVVTVDFIDKSIGLLLDAPIHYSALSDILGYGIVVLALGRPNFGRDVS